VEIAEPVSSIETEEVEMPNGVGEVLL